MSAEDDWESEVADLLSEAARSRSADRKVALAERAVRLADTHQAVETGYRAREELIEAAVFGGQAEKALVAFAWCRARTREDPERFPEQELVWKYKWILPTLPAHAGIRRAQVEAAHADFESVFEGGFGERARAKMDLLLALGLGEHDRVPALLDRWLGTRRDFHSDCAACDLDTHIEVLHTLGQPAEAIRLAGPIRSGRLSCAEVPHITNGYLAEAGLVVGDDALVRDTVVNGYAKIRANRDFLPPLGRFLGVLARTGNLPAGLRLFERHLGWHLACRVEGSSLPFLAGARALFEALRAAGETEVALHLPRTFALYREDGRYPVDAVASHLDAALVASCARFDARNGNDTRTRWQAADRQRPTRELPIAVG